MGLIRTVPTAMKTALNDHFYPILMVHLDWPDTPVYAHSGVGSITYNSQTWHGVGDFGGVDVPSEEAGIVPTRATIQLLGLAPDMFDSMDDIIRNRDSEILLGLTTTQAGNVLVSDPVSLFYGYMDYEHFVVEDDSNGNLTHGIAVELGSGPGARSTGSYYHTAEEQAALYPSDTAGQHLIYNVARSAKLTWPET